jgi:hypothetical protein
MSIYKPFNNLYIKKATNKIQEWEVYVNKKTDEQVFLCMKYGELNGKKILKEKQIRTTKAGRTYLEEALKQAETKYNEKVNKEGYSEDKNNVSMVIRPMLANKFNMNKPNIKFPCLGEPKYDGNRGIIYRNSGSIHIESRNGTKIHYFDHIREDINDLLKDMQDGFYLDGELFTHDLTFNVINGICNKKPSTVKITAKKAQKYEKDALYMSKIKYYIFDCFDVKNLDMPLQDRKTLLKSLFKNKKFNNIVLIESEILNNINDVKLKHDEYVKNGGYEGIILREINSPYELKKRSKYLQKYKEFQDDEFIIVSYEEDTDGGVVWVCETNITPKSKFNVRPRGDMEYRREMYINGDKYLGAKLIVVFQEYTDNIHGIPRFPVGKDFRNIQDLS